MGTGGRRASGGGTWLLFAGGGLGGGAFLGFLEAVAVAVDLDDLGAVDEAVDQGDGAGRMGEHLGPLGESLVGADEDGALCLVASSDDLEEEVGIAVVVGEVPDLVDAQESRHGVTAKSPGEGGGAVLCSEVREHVAGGGEAHGVAVDESVVGDGA